MVPITVLLTSAGVATAVNVIHALRHSTLLDVKIVSVDMDPFSAGLYLADKHHMVPPAKKPQYLDEILKICKSEEHQIKEETCRSELRGRVYPHGSQARQRDQIYRVQEG